MFKILIKIIVREHLACLLLVYHWASYSSFWSFSLGQDSKRRKPWWAPDNVTMSPFLMDPEIFLHTVQTKWIFINNFFCWDWSEVLHTWNFNVHIGLHVWSQYPRWLCWSWGSPSSSWFLHDGAHTGIQSAVSLIIANTLSLETVKELVVLGEKTVKRSCADFIPANVEEQRRWFAVRTCRTLPTQLSLLS